MGEYRKDYYLPRWVIINERRNARVIQFRKASLQDVKSCFFCPGNEKTTPPEIFRVGKKDKWKIRVFPNKFAIADTNRRPGLKGKYLIRDYAYGEHEVIVETERHDRQLWDLSLSRFQEILRVYVMRIRELEEKKLITYVLVFKNHGIKGGTSIVHTHTQVIALDRIPPDVKQKLKLSTRDGCEYCRIIKKESSSRRLAFSNSTMLAICPYASRYNFELLILPRKHLKRLDEFGEREYHDLADILRRSLRKLRSMDLSYNFYIHYAPIGRNLHFHIELTPRKATWAGFELGTGIIINSVSPETAADYYRR